MPTRTPIRSILIALISSSFGSYLCYIGQYDAGAAMFGAAIAALALSSDSSRDSDNSEVQELRTRVALLEQELNNQREIAQRDTQIALLESRLERLDQITNILPESTIEVEGQLPSGAEEENTLEEEEQNNDN